MLATRLSTYRKYYRASGPTLASLALLLPTFDAPHWTLLFRRSDGEEPGSEAELLGDLLDILGPALDNPKYVPPEARRR